MKRRKKSTLINFANKHKINYESITEKYGEKFTFNLLKYVYNGYSPLTFNNDCDHFKDDQFDYKWDDFKLEIKKSGLKIKFWSEPFIDEDTGEIVNIKRSEFVYNN